MKVAVDPASDIELPPEPYPGLRPFEPSEWAIFFGREPMIDEVIARLAKQHLVIVHGAPLRANDGETSESLKV